VAWDNPADSPASAAGSLVAWDNPADSPASVADSLEAARNPVVAVEWLPDDLESVAAAKGCQDCRAATDSWLEKMVH
jgi:hypothetical protein